MAKFFIEFEADSQIEAENLVEQINVFVPFSPKMTLCEANDTAVEILKDLRQTERSKKDRAGQSGSWKEYIATGHAAAVLTDAIDRIKGERK